jgi:BASS family bile acid:Na+ symporter
MAISFGVSRLARLDDRQSTAIALELGVHNSALAIAVGASLASDVTLPAAVYSSFMLVTGGAFAWAMSRRNAPAQGVAGSRPSSSPGGGRSGASPELRRG